MIIAGLDPGMTGAVSVFNRGELLRIEDMPCFDGRVDGLELSSILDGVEYAYIENQHPMPKNGSIASFKLGLNYGIALGVLEQMAIPIIRIPVSAWKNFNGLATKPKEASLALARELWPHFKPMLTRQRDHNRAEAALIGRYGVYKQIQGRNTDDEGEDAARPEGDRAVRGSLGQDRHPAGATPGDQRRVEAAGRRGDRVAQVRPFVRPEQDSLHRGGAR